jgi:uncharacterized protein (DUF1330 family)
MSVYVIFQGPVLDQGAYEAYKTAAGPQIEASGGRYLARGGEKTLLEGDLPDGRVVIVEFESRQAALDWYAGDEYQSIRKLREGVAQTNAFIVDGVN